MLKLAKELLSVQYTMFECDGNNIRVVVYPGLSCDWDHPTLGWKQHPAWGEWGWIAGQIGSSPAATTYFHPWLSTSIARYCHKDSSIYDVSVPPCVACSADYHWLLDVRSRPASMASTCTCEEVEWGTCWTSEVSDSLGETWSIAVTKSCKAQEMSGGMIVVTVHEVANGDRCETCSCLCNASSPEGAGCDSRMLDNPCIGDESPLSEVWGTTLTGKRSGVGWVSKTRNGAPVLPSEGRSLYAAGSTAEVELTEDLVVDVPTEDETLFARRARLFIYVRWRRTVSFSLHRWSSSRVYSSGLMVYWWCLFPCLDVNVRLQCWHFGRQVECWTFATCYKVNNAVVKKNMVIIAQHQDEDIV